MPLRPDSDVPLFQQIVDGFERRILAGELRAGDELPSVREFAVSHSVNPNTVSKAYQALQQLSLAEAQRGLGLRVAAMESGRVQRRRAEILEAEVGALAAVARALQVPGAEVVRMLQEKLRNPR